MKVISLLANITQPTRITDYTSTLIDHMYTNALDKCITAGICLTDISDHFPIFLISEEMKIVDRSKKKVIRDFKNFQTETFRNNLQEINWDHLIDSNDVNGPCKKFIDAFVSVINKHAPHRKITKGPVIIYGRGGGQRESIMQLILLQRERSRHKICNETV
jgi:hypothetical protein